MWLFSSVKSTSCFSWLGELKIISSLGTNYKFGKNYKHILYLRIFSGGRRDDLTEGRKGIFNDSHSWENKTGSRSSGINIVQLSVNQLSEDRESSRKNKEIFCNWKFFRTVCPCWFLLTYIFISQVKFPS